MADWVLLPAGKNRVEFEYSPTLFRLLMVLNQIMLVLLFVFVIFVVVQRQRRIRARRSSGKTHL